MRVEPVNVCRVAHWDAPIGSSLQPEGTPGLAVVRGVHDRPTPTGPVGLGSVGDCHCHCTSPVGIDTVTPPACATGPLRTPEALTEKVPSSFHSREGSLPTSA